MKRIAIILVVTVLFGCKKKEDRTCWKSIGEEKVYTLAMNPFNEVELNDHLNMTISPSVDWSVEIHTGENLINHIQAEVIDGRLVLDDNNTCDFLRNLGHQTEIHVYCPTLNRIDLRGSGNSTGTISGSRLNLDLKEANGSHAYQFNGDSILTIVNDGAADLTLSGNAQYAYYFFFGTGNIDAKGLQLNEALIDWNSVKDLSLSVSGGLYGSINSFGDVYYTGSPTIIVSTTSEGQLIKVD